MRGGRGGEGEGERREVLMGDAGAEEEVFSVYGVLWTAGGAVWCGGRRDDLYRVDGGRWRVLCYVWRWVAVGFQSSLAGACLLVWSFLAEA